MRVARNFLELYPPPVIFDEVRYAPDLLPYIKEKVDANRARNGQLWRDKQGEERRANGRRGVGESPTGRKG